MDTNDRHPSIQHVAQFFSVGHLPGDLQAISQECHDLAERMIAVLPDGPELVVGLRKLLEAKDAFVRTAVATREGS